MLDSLLKKVFGNKNERELKKINPVVDEINELESKMGSLSDEELKGLTAIFKERISNGETLDKIMPEAFAAVREVSKRNLGMRHFDCQLLGGIVLNEGKIAEMKTGEGKTLAATLPLYLNALTGKGAHLVTVNDYLARRDTRWMGVIYHNLGLSIGVIQHEVSFLYDPSFTGANDDQFNLRPCSRKEAYQADITYGTNNEFGFDYLRDNMKYSLDDYVQRDPHYAIVDEVDSILIDEARTPLIISGQAEESTEKYYTINSIIPGLKLDTHFTVDEKAKQVIMTDEGINKVEELLKIENLYDPLQIETLHHVNQGLKAYALFKRDVDYVVKDGEVIIVDEFTGRLMPGRRWSDGLHQAVEAKEGVNIENENQTLATITFQNYFRMYEKLAGMTGTADTEAGEFKGIYNLDVAVIPTNQPMIRDDQSDQIYKTETEKFNAVVNEIAECSKKGQPVLVGTISIENSEKISATLSRKNIAHHVLNAKHHDKEAEIVAQAGRVNAVTIATNMAGRGTDIVLGGNPEAMAEAKAGKDNSTDEYKSAFEAAAKICEVEKQRVIELGGLHILGTERHESRRIDNQLRGRSGRQGDPGASRFYLSLEDDLLRIFGGERIGKVMDKLGMEEGVPIEHSFINKAIENAQSKVEAHNFDIRKHVLEYDDVMNQQREVVYNYRKQILAHDGVRALVHEAIEEVAGDVISIHIEEKAYPEDWDIKQLKDSILNQFGMVMEGEELKSLGSRDAVIEDVKEKATLSYDAKVADVGEHMFSQLERIIMLQALDTLWKDHLLSMDHLKEGIGLRGYAQVDPLNEYKKEGFELFADMVFRMKSEAISRLTKVQIEHEEDISQFEPVEKKQHFTLSSGEEKTQEKKKTKSVQRGVQKVGRNSPCPCGSGKKFKKCCGK